MFDINDDIASKITIAIVTVGIPAFITALFPYFRELLRWLKSRTRKSGGSPPLGQPRKPIKVSWLLFGICLIVYFIVALLPYLPSKHSTAPSLNARLTEEAWWAFDDGHYRRAILKAEDCYDLFHLNAEVLQHQLIATNAPIPPVGNKFSEEEKLAVLDRGELNDSATCLFIKGRALEKIGKKNDARIAYQTVTNLTYARAWDTNGFFWSPAQSASGRLVIIQTQ